MNNSDDLLEYLTSVFPYTYITLREPAINDIEINDIEINDYFPNPSINFICFSKSYEDLKKYILRINKKKQSSNNADVIFEERSTVCHSDLERYYSNSYEEIAGVKPYFVCKHIIISTKNEYFNNLICCSSQYYSFSYSVIYVSSNIVKIEIKYYENNILEHERAILKTQCCHIFSSYLDDKKILYSIHGNEIGNKMVNMNDYDSRYELYYDSENDVVSDDDFDEIIDLDECIFWYSSYQKNYEMYDKNNINIHLNFKLAINDKHINHYLSKYKRITKYYVQSHTKLLYKQRLIQLSKSPSRYLNSIDYETFNNINFDTSSIDHDDGIIKYELDCIENCLFNDDGNLVV